MVGQEELLTPTRVVVNQLSAQWTTSGECILNVEEAVEEMAFRTMDG